MKRKFYIGKRKLIATLILILILVSVALYSIYAEKFIEFLIGIVGSATGAFGAFFVASWEFNHRRKIELQNNLELLNEIFSQTKIEVRDNRNRLNKLLAIYEDSKEWNLDSWQYVEAVSKSLKDTSYQQLLNQGLIHLLPTSITQTLLNSYGMVEGLQNMIREGGPGSRFYVSSAKNQNVSEAMSKTVIAYSRTVKNYHDFSVNRLWDFIPNKSDEIESDIKKLPFSAELIKYILDHPEFDITLRGWQPDISAIVPVILITNSPAKPSDEVIGVFRLNFEGLKNKQKPLFIQDYIVRDVNYEFTIYSDIKRPDSTESNIKSIKEFEKIYGASKYYGTENGKLDHYYSKISELPTPVRPAAKSVLKEFKHKSK